MNTQGAFLAKAPSPPVALESPVNSPERFVSVKYSSIIDIRANVHSLTLSLNTNNERTTETTPQ